MSRYSRRLILVLLVGACLVGAACGPGDPRADARTISLSVRVTGPPSTSLETLTFRVSLVDAAGETFEERWQVIDLTEVPRGGPKDMFLGLDAADQPVEGVGLSLVLSPTPEEEAQIRELQ